jgi:hypothetical protein
VVPVGCTDSNEDCSSQLAFGKQPVGTMAYMGNANVLSIQVHVEACRGGY